MASISARTVPIYCLLVATLDVVCLVRAFYSDSVPLLPPPPSLIASSHPNHNPQSINHQSIIDDKQSIISNHTGIDDNSAPKKYAIDDEEKEYIKKKLSTKEFDSLARQLKDEKSFNLKPSASIKAECRQAMDTVKETINEWDRLIGKVRSSLTTGQIKVKPTIRANLERTLTTMQGYADGARKALAQPNLRDVNRNCRKAGFELARLSVNKEVSRSEPQLEANVRKARQIYKSYRKACGGPAY